MNIIHTPQATTVCPLCRRTIPVKGHPTGYCCGNMIVPPAVGTMPFAPGVHDTVTLTRTRVMPDGNRRYAGTTSTGNPIILDVIGG